MHRAVPLIAALSIGLSAPTEAAFETLGRAGRASAMGDAFVVHASDPSALWYNTAGLALVGNRQILVDYARLFPELDAGPNINLWTVSYAQQLAGGWLGAGFAGLGADFYTENGFALGYSRSSGDRLSLGLGLRFLRWSADGYQAPDGGPSDPDRSGNGLGVDVGARVVLLKRQDSTVVLGFSGRDLNEPDVSEGGGTGIPRRLVIGLGYEDPLYLLEADLELLDGDRRVRVGGEYKLGGNYDLRLRAGASGIAGEGTAGEVDGGFGLKFGKAVINYAYRYTAQIDAGGNQWLSLGYSF